MHIRHLSALSLIVGAAASCGSVENSPQSVESASSEAALVKAEGNRGGASFTPVAAARTKSPGVAVPNALPPELIESPVAQGATPVENPASVALSDGSTSSIPDYGYNGDGPLVPAPGDVPSATHLVEATKTEPDKNTYLVLPGQTGADASYDYGTHFLFQGHEGGTSGSITRINLDADDAHKVTILASVKSDGSPLPAIDGSTWDPFAQKLLFTTEDGTLPGASVFQASLDYPSVVEDLNGSFGIAAYEGIQNDADGNVWLVEDSGGATSATYPHSKQPNSFVFRFVPHHAHDLTHGALQALQVLSRRTGDPIVFHPGQPEDAASPDVGDLHAYGNVFKTRWVTLHETSVDGTTSFDANALAKARLATPFKRPENGQFRPGTKFGEFYFAETGDTDNRTEVGSAFGGFGAIFKLSQSRPSASQGTLSLLYTGDAAHSSFDNVGFWSRDEVVFVEDAGDTLHTQRNAFDSAWVFDVRADYAKGALPVRLVAEGRDPSATLDSELSAFAGFQNEGDNEITGFHVSDGDRSEGGLLGAKIPTPFSAGWRVFFTQQHGENFTWEILAKR